MPVYLLGHNKKRHLHAHRNVYFMNNPEAKYQDQMQNIKRRAKYD